MIDRQPFEEPQLRRRDDVMSEIGKAAQETIEGFSGPVNMKLVQSAEYLGMLNFMEKQNQLFKDLNEHYRTEREDTRQKRDKLDNLLLAHIADKLHLDIKEIDAGPHETSSKDISADIADEVAGAVSVAVAKVLSEMLGKSPEDEG